MKEKYNIVISERQAVPRSKRMREAGQSSSSAAVLVSGTGGGGSSCDGHVHTNLPALERIGFDENDDKYLMVRVGSVDDETGELVVTREKIKSGYADKAHDLDEDSPVNERFLHKDQADETDFRLTVGGLTSKELIEANNGLVIRKTEAVEPMLMSLLSEEFEDGIVEENEDVFTEEIGGGDTPSSTTLGELQNVSNDVDTASQGALFVKGDNWEAIPPVVSSLTDYNNMLIPVYHQVLGQWVFISVSAISGGVTPPVTLEMVLDTGLLDINKLA